MSFYSGPCHFHYGGCIVNIEIILDGSLEFVCFKRELHLHHPAECVLLIWSIIAGTSVPTSQNRKQLLSYLYRHTVRRSWLTNVFTSDHTSLRKMLQGQLWSKCLLSPLWHQGAAGCLYEALQLHTKLQNIFHYRADIQCWHNPITCSDGSTINSTTQQPIIMILTWT